MRYSLLLCLSLLVACGKKEVDPTDRYLDNKIDIVVYNVFGDSSLTSFRGKKAPMYFGGGGYSTRLIAEGKDSNGASTITFSHLPYGPDTIVECIYSPKNKLEYKTNPGSNTGSIKFNFYENNYVAGYFNANCYSDTSFVRITGTFSGGYN